MLSQAQTNGDSGTEREESEQTRDRPRAAGVAADGAHGAASQLHQRAGDPTGGRKRNRTANRSWSFCCRARGILCESMRRLCGERRAVLSYQALTGLLPPGRASGKRRSKAAGQYHFEPGVEMQHDTSPHCVEGGRQEVQGADGLRCLVYSRMLFFQIHPTFNTIRLQGISHRRATPYGRRSGARDDR